MNSRRSRTSPSWSFALVASVGLAGSTVGCSSKTPEVDTAVVTPDPAVKPTPAPAPVPPPAPAPAPKN